MAWGRGAKQLEESYSDFNDHHLCSSCGCRLADHKGADDENGPALRCPKTSSWGRPSSTSFGKKSEAAIDKMLKSHWSAKKTTFKPV